VQTTQRGVHIRKKGLCELSWSEKHVKKKKKDEAVHGNQPIARKQQKQSEGERKQLGRGAPEVIGWRISRKKNQDPRDSKLRVDPERGKEVAGKAKAE